MKKSWNIIKGLSIQAAFHDSHSKGAYVNLRFLGGKTSTGKRIPSTSMAVNRETYDAQYEQALKLLCKLNRIREPYPAWKVRQPTWDAVLHKLGVIEIVGYRYTHK